MRHARYYQLVNGKLQQALGSDSIVFLDDYHLSTLGCHNRVISHALKLNASLNKGYVGYAMFHGRSLLSSTPMEAKIFPTSIEYVELCRDKKVMV